MPKKDTRKQKASNRKSVREELMNDIISNTPGLGEPQTLHNKVVKRIAISVNKLREIEYEISGSIDVDAIRKGIDREGRNTSDGERLQSIQNVLLQSIKPVGVDKILPGDDFTMPDMVWLKNAVAKFFNDVKDKVLLGGREELVVRENSYGEKVKNKQFIHHKYIISAKCSSVLSDIEIYLENSDKGLVEDSLKIKCVECVFGKNTSGKILCDYNPDIDRFPAYHANLTYMITSTGDVIIERPIQISSRLIIIPDDKISSIEEYTTSNLKIAIKQLLMENFQDIKILPGKLDDIQLKYLRDKNGIEYPVLVLDNVKIKLNNSDASLEAFLAQYLFNDTIYRYGEIILFADIYDSYDQSTAWESLDKKQREQYVKKLEDGAVKSLNGTLARHFGLGNSNVISIDRKNLGLRVNKSFFKLPIHKRK